MDKNASGFYILPMLGLGVEERFDRDAYRAKNNELNIVVYKNEASKEFSGFIHDDYDVRFKIKINDKDLIMVVCKLRAWLDEHNART